MRAAPLPCPPARVATAWAVLVCLGAPPGAIAGPPPPPRLRIEDVSRDMDAPRLDVPLESDGAGRLRHRGDGFTAIVFPDGTVEFKEDPGITARPSLFGFDPVRMRMHEPPPDRHDPAWSAVVDRAVFMNGGPAVQMIGGGGGFPGLADGPPERRHTRAKRAFLAATAAMRLRMRYTWLKGQIDRQLAELGGELAALWKDPSLPLAERKRRLFRRWEECEESTVAHTEIDALRLDAGRTARAKIEAFIRMVAPRGSTQAYSEDELRQLNRDRQGRPQFRPYDPPVAPPIVVVKPVVEAAAEGDSIDAEPARREPDPREHEPPGPSPAPAWLPPPRE